MSLPFMHEATGGPRDFHMLAYPPPPAMSSHAAAAAAAAAVPLSSSAASPVLSVSSGGEQAFASLSLLLQITMLAVAFVVGHVLRRHKVHFLHEGTAAMMIGLFVGMIGNWRGTQESVREWLGFKEDVFLLFLLPPIIFESGFSLQVKPFFNNFGAIVTFACLGTFFATFVTGVMVYLGGLLFLMYKLSFLEALIFGALISATDPVATLSIFQDAGVDSNLFALVFGESVLNDAVAITLYRTFMSVLNHPSSDPSATTALQYAAVTLVGSTSIGVGVALACALLFKYAGLAVNNLHNFECCLIVLFPYVSYLVAEGLSLSGIIAILFCGMAMKHYAYPNLSLVAQSLSVGFFQLIASLAETFTFIYMGTEIALGENQSWGHVSFITFSIIFIGIARAASIFPCAHVINLFRAPSKQIPDSHQKALWFSGLRGAVSFGMALQAADDLPNRGHGRAIYTTTTAVVMLTVVLLGGSTVPVMRRLEVMGERNSVEDVMGDESQECDSDEESPLSTPHQRSTRSFPLHTHGHPPAAAAATAADGDRALQIGLLENPSFEHLDSRYIRPFFTAASAQPQVDSSRIYPSTAPSNQDVADKGDGGEGNGTTEFNSSSQTHTLQEHQSGRRGFEGKGGAGGALGE